MKNIRSIVSMLLVILVVLLNGCQESNYTLGELVTPSNISLSYELVGADGENPNGDGSGVVTFEATADNAFNFSFDYGDGKDVEIAPGGITSHIFSQDGINTFNVVVTAVGTGGLSAKDSVQVTVYSGFQDEEARLFLSGGSSKSWYWAADTLGHLGLGPNDMVYPGGDHTKPNWYQAVPWEKSATSLYETELVFTTDGTNLTMEQKNPTGEAFIVDAYSQELGLGPEGSHTFDIAGIKNVFFGKPNSIATEDGGYRGTSMFFSDGGFMGFYAGTSEYEIIDISEHLLTVRMVQTNVPLFAWYHIFRDEKPIQE